MPSDARLLPYRSNIPHLSKFCFEKIDAGFAARCVEEGAAAIAGGENYGQGSSREHAALAPLHLGVKFVVAKSFARIHRSNLINSGILPLTFENPADYDMLEEGQELVIKNAREQIRGRAVVVEAPGAGTSFRALTGFNDTEKEVALAGGRINMMQSQARA
jgi:aconitate hydratase